MIASASLTVLLVLASLGECVSLSSAVQPSPVTQTDPRQMRFEPVQFTPPEPERVVLENGMVVYLLEDHELPLVTITAMIRTGAWLDPPDKIGLATLAGATMGACQDWKAWSLWCGIDDETQPWSSPATTSTPPCGDEP